MRKRFTQRINGSLLKDLILGGQDGLVNVLGIVLGMAAAVHEIRIVIIAGLAATFAESISMAAVAYTSMKAQEDFYIREFKKEKYILRHQTLAERKVVYEIYYNKGFRGNLLRKIVKQITSNKKMWLDILMKESNLPKVQYSPQKSAFIVGASAMLGSVIPIIPFFFYGDLEIFRGVVFSVFISSFALFIAGSFEGFITRRNWFNEGFRMMIIGLIAAFAGFMIGDWLGRGV